jgi:hypothetical protein
MSVIVVPPSEKVQLLVACTGVKTATELTKITKVTARAASLTFIRSARKILASRYAAIAIKGALRQHGASRYPLKK